MNPAFRILRLVAPLLAGFSLMSCVGEAPQRRPVSSHRVLHEWRDDGGPGKVTIRISLADQIAEFERGGRYIGWCYVATGKEGHGTRDGRYRIMEKIIDKYSNRYGWIEDEFGNIVDKDAKAGQKIPKGMVYVPAPMPYWMRLTSYGIGMHGGPIPEPGKPASHGCIRIPKDFVPVLFGQVEVGTPVEITHAPRKHAPFGAMGAPVIATSPDLPPTNSPRRVVDTRPATEADLLRLLPPPPPLPPLQPSFP
jgi:hypothetical protein